MKILLTNDDGVHAPGLVTLEQSLSRKHTVFTVAPDRERSAISHAVTLHVPLRVSKVREHEGGAAFSVTGTPADCVKLAVNELLDFKPDLVVSGINPGPNVGNNLNYSGTVSAAREAALLGLFAIAVSVSSPEAVSYSTAARFLEQLAGKVAEKGLPDRVFLNVNLPDVPVERIRGVKVCRQGNARLEEAFHKRLDPRNQVYYWQGSETQLFGDSPDEDGVALRENYIALTPVRCDATEHGFLPVLESWNLALP
ncbi:MAG: 5'/3'-nucleotidase SurE [Deltaproteobacteria bacterium]|nr:5'/3'-nucleotidase SurE [Deltaproteobacteria bacterium]